MKPISIASIGDCCVDIYPDQNKWFLGGTAYNVAMHARRAGAEASLVSAVGTDEFGKQYYEQCRKLRINIEFLKTFPGKTSSVQIPLDEEGRPIFSGWDLGVLSELILSPSDKQILKKHDAVRGILLRPLQGLFKQFSDMEMDTSTLKIGDFAGGSQYSVEKEEILKYIHGIDIIVRSVGKDLQPFHENNELPFLKDIAQRHDKIAIALLGKEGSIVFIKDKEFRQPAIKTEVTDTTGAGDAYIAHFLVSYLADHNIPKAMENATIAAAEVITYLGSSIEPK